MDEKRVVPFYFAVLAIAYLALAYVLVLWPFQKPLVKSVHEHVYLVFIDITASNSDRSNWSAEADRFVATLNEGDRIRFMIIDDKTSSNADYGAELEIPIVDPNAGYPYVGEQLEAKAKAIDAATTTLKSLLSTRSGARVTDLLGVFKRLEQLPPPPAVNSVVIFSDGQESAAGAAFDRSSANISAEGDDRINLETTCVDRHTLPRLISVAQRFIGSSEVTRVADITWVMPNRVGRVGCNSLPELRGFWRGVIVAQVQDGPAPRLKFETNPF